MATGRWLRTKAESWLALPSRESSMPSTFS